MFPNAGFGAYRESAATSNADREARQQSRFLWFLHSDCVKNTLYLAEARQSWISRD